MIHRIIVTCILNTYWPLQKIETIPWHQEFFQFYCLTWENNWWGGEGYSRPYKEVGSDMLPLRSLPSGWHLPLTLLPWAGAKSWGCLKGRSPVIPLNMQKQWAVVQWAVVGYLWKISQLTLGIWMEGQGRWPSGRRIAVPGTFDLFYLWGCVLVELQNVVEFFSGTLPWIQDPVCCGPLGWMETQKVMSLYPWPRVSGEEKSTVSERVPSPLLIIYPGRDITGQFNIDL